MEKALDVLDSIKREIITKRFGIQRNTETNNPLSHSKNFGSVDRSPNKGEELSVHQVDKNSENSTPSDVFTSSLKSGLTKSIPVPSYDELAQDLTANGNPKEILKYATKHENNRLVLDGRDIQALEQEALRELARGNRIRYTPKR